jgi:hypothetical protein
LFLHDQLTRICPRALRAQILKHHYVWKLFEAKVEASGADWRRKRFLPRRRKPKYTHRFRGHERYFD